LRSPYGNYCTPIIIVVKGYLCGTINQIPWQMAKNPTKASRKLTSPTAVSLSHLLPLNSNHPLNQNVNQANHDPEPILVRLVGGEELEPFEEQTIAIAKETLAISRRTYWVAVFGFLAAVAAAVFVGSQAKVMSYQTQIMAGQAESDAAAGSLSAVQVQKQLLIAQQQAKAAQDNANGIQSQTRTAERAWISPDAFNVVNGVFNAKVVADQPFHLRLTFLNTGHTPAMNAKFVVMTKQVDSTNGKFSLPNFDYKPSDYVSIGTIQPRGRPFEDYWHKLDQAALDGIDKTHRFYVHGKFTYDDVFQIPHWFTFCYFLSPGGAYGICKEHNDVDKEPN
jgi:hypothetical protein